MGCCQAQLASKSVQVNKCKTNLDLTNGVSNTIDKSNNSSYDIGLDEPSFMFHDDEGNLLQPKKNNINSLLKDTLPKQLKNHANGILTLSKFWKQNVSVLIYDQNKIGEYDLLCILFYMNLFKNLPEARKLFLRGDIGTQARKFMDMIGWLTRVLGQLEGKNLIDRLEKLGKDHIERGVKAEYYPIMLQALHDTLTETFPVKYTLRIRFCITQMYNTVYDLMFGKTFDNIVTKSLNDCNPLDFISSLDDCLSHSVGIKYLECYMKQQFCIELLLFLKEFQNYRGLISVNERNKLGKEILNKYIKNGSPMEVNLPHKIKQNIFDTLKNNNNNFKSNLFDDSGFHIRRLIQTSVWNNFRKLIISMAGIENEYKNIIKNEQKINTITPIIDTTSNVSRTPTYVDLLQETSLVNV